MLVIAPRIFVVAEFDSEGLFLETEDGSVIGAVSYEALLDGVLDIHGRNGADLALTVAGEFDAMAQRIREEVARTYNRSEWDE